MSQKGGGGGSREMGHKECKFIPSLKNVRMGRESKG